MGTNVFAPSGLDIQNMIARSLSRPPSAQVSDGSCLTDGTIFLALETENREVLSAKDPKSACNMIGFSDL